MALFGLEPITGYAESNGTYKDIAREALQRQVNMEVTLGVVYRMTSELYIRRFGQKKYENLIWNNENKCNLCNRKLDNEPDK